MSEQNAGAGRKSQNTIIVVALIGFVLCACLAVTGAVVWRALPQLRKTPTPTEAPVGAVTLAPATVIVIVTATPEQAATLTPAPIGAQPTATPASGDAPAPTPPPTAAAPSEELPEGTLFYDDFRSRQASEDKGWGFADGDSADYVWSPNQLTIAVKKSDWIASVWPDGTYGDFAAETEARAIEGSWAEYGLLFRVGGERSARNYYLFGVTTDGDYHVWSKLEGAWVDEDVVSDTPSAQIGQDKGSNILGVIVEGNQIALYINHQLVQTITDDAIAEEGNVGLYAGTGDNELARVTFRRLAVLEADAARAAWK